LCQIARHQEAVAGVKKEQPKHAKQFEQKTLEVLWRKIETQLGRI